MPSVLNYNSKSILATSDSFPLIMSHVYFENTDLGAIANSEYEPHAGLDLYQSYINIIDTAYSIVDWFQFKSIIMWMAAAWIWESPQT